MKEIWHKVTNVALIGALGATMVLALFKLVLPVSASPAGLTFHSGFEAGDLAEWNYPPGAVSVQGDIKRTGDYALKVDPTSSHAFVYGPGSAQRVTVCLYIMSLPPPNTNCSILGAEGGVNVRLSSDQDQAQKLTLYGGNQTVTGNTELATSIWYRISLCLDATINTAKVYLDGAEECSSDTISGDSISNWLGPQSQVTIELYLDDYASDDIESTDDIGDIRVLRSQPNIMGTYTGEWQQVPTSTNHYEKIDEHPADDDDYTWADADKTQLDESYGLEDCSVFGLAANDTIKAVSIWWRFDTEEGGNGAYACMVRDDGTDYYDWTITDYGSPTWLNRYYATMPNGGAAWTQARFNALEVGVATNHRNKDMRLYCVMVMVAYLTPTLGQTWYFSSDVGYIMYKGDTSKTAGTVTVADDGSQIWRADEATTVNVGFPAGTWTGHITFDGGSSDTTVRVYVGKWDGSDFTPSSENEFADVSGSSDFSISASSFTVPETKWLACKIEDYDAVADSNSVMVSVGSNYSYVSSPPSDPGYPIPELPTIILIGIGLASLGAYFAVKRRSRRRASPANANSQTFLN